jgi:hypothetical protein
MCIPEACRPLVHQVISQLRDGIDGAGFSEDGTLTKKVLDVAQCVILLLIPEFSVENVVPRHVTKRLRALLESRPNEITLDKLMLAKREIGMYAPEVVDLLILVQSHGDTASKEMVTNFLLGLCSSVELSAETDSEPPPWEPIPGTYNPALRGKH